MSLRGAKKIPSLCSEQAVQSHGICHCEERSDVAISTFFYEIAALPAVSRNDKGIQVIALPIGLAMTYIKYNNFEKSVKF